MKRLLSITIALFFCADVLLAQNVNSILNYKSNAVDTFFGTPVADPYRWLELLHSDSTQKWLKEQAKITHAERMKFDGTFSDVFEDMNIYKGISSPNFIHQGPYYFQLQFNNSRFGTRSLYYKKRADGFLIEAYTPDNSTTFIDDFSLSNDARYVAVMLSSAGSDWRHIKIQDLKKDKTLKDEIDWVKFSNVAWTDSGFFYSRYEKPPEGLTHVVMNLHQQLCFHKLGTSQEEDKAIYAIPSKANTIFQFDITSNKKYLIIYSVAKLGGDWCHVVMYKDLDEGLFSDPQLFIATPANKDVSYNVIDYVNGKFMVKTNLDAPHNRVLLFDKDSLNHATEFIREYKDILKSVHHIVGNKIFCLYFSDGAYTGGVFNYDGELVHGITFPEGATIGNVQKINDTVITLDCSTFYFPPVVYHLNLNTYKLDIPENTEVHIDVTKYKTSIVHYKSKDGTEVPMYLTYKKKLNLKNNNPVILYGYGGFGISTTPFYSYANIIFFANNGILAVPLIRGGGEFGEEWHDAGKGLNKQNSFDDFISAAEYLIDSGYTTKEHLAIEGGSNGGLLVGAVLTQRPDLFQVAIGKVGVYDMIRYPLFTGGKLWISEYGIASDSIQFHNLFKYSPLHNVKPNTDYPATLLLTAENDDRVPPFHTYKFLAALQANSSNDKPHILYFENNAGHQGAESWSDESAENAFILGFIFKQFNLKLTTKF